MLVDFEIYGSCRGFSDGVVAREVDEEEVGVAMGVVSGDFRG